VAQIFIKNLRKYRQGLNNSTIFDPLIGVRIEPRLETIVNIYHQKFAAKSRLMNEMLNSEIQYVRSSEFLE
jgi:hypothetical protein